MNKTLKIDLDQSGKGVLLGVAINHYISIADQIGVGAFAEVSDERIAVPILVNRTIPRDQEDFACLRARLEFVEPVLRHIGINAKLTRAPIELHTNMFDVYLLELPENIDKLFEFVGVLIHDPAPRGWGSTKPLVDKFLEQFPELKMSLQNLGALWTPVFQMIEHREIRRAWTPGAN